MSERIHVATSSAWAAGETPGFGEHSPGLFDAVLPSTAPALPQAVVQEVEGLVDELARVAFGVAQDQPATASQETTVTPAEKRRPKSAQDA